ncbi:hypothetical protein [Paenibacillus sp. GYB003]|uniref:hypothetical protein n=1 Tax=Paenibacillus sp. GYB003 TaxID=2994392 RepID=UPI002F96DCB6
MNNCGGVACFEEEEPGKCGIPTSKHERNGGAMKEKITIEIFEVMKYLEIDPKKAYQFLSRLQYKEDAPSTEGVRTRETTRAGEKRAKSRKMTNR